MKRKNIRILAGIILSAAVAAAATGQELNNPDAVSEQTHPSLAMSLNANASGQANTDIDSGGSFSLTRLSAGLTVPVQIDDVSTLRSSVKYELAAYDFDDIPDPWDNINTWSANTIYSWEGYGAWSYFAGGMVRMSAESGADTDDAFTGGGLAGANYDLNESLSLGLGLAVISQIEDDALVLPLITARWQLSEDVGLKLGLSDVATSGYGVAAIWKMDRDWEFACGAQMHKSRFRIDGYDETEDGVGQDKATVIYVNATYHASSDIDVSGYLGATSGELRIEDSSGDKLSDSDYDTAALFGVKATFRL